MAPLSQPIRYWDREKGREETERVYGEAAIGWLYGTWLGQRMAEALLSRPVASRLYGAYQSSRASRSKIRPFIRKFGVPMEEFEDRRFASFNDFFSRKFRPGARPFEQGPLRMPAFCEGRYLAFERVTPDLRFPVKGELLTARALLEDPALAEPFREGPILIARLCPTDYHRFHFPDDGRVVTARGLRGKLHSVNPAALRYDGRILCSNERHVSVLETLHLGRLAYIEVGALCVGKIVQSHPGREFRRGEEKGYFLFGASTVIVLGEPGRWRPDPDLLERTAGRMETFVKLGRGIARTIS